MKNIFLTVVVVLFNSGGFSTANAFLQSEKTYVKVEVDGLTCPFCVYGLEKRLKTLEGIEDLNIDIENGWATFFLPKKTKDTENNIKALVEKAGFSAKNIAFSSTSFLK